MLQGSLKEIQYDWPDRGELQQDCPTAMRNQKETVLSKDEVTYITDNVSCIAKVKVDLTNRWRSMAFIKFQILTLSTLRCLCTVCHL